MANRGRYLGVAPQAGVAGFLLGWLWGKKGPGLVEGLTKMISPPEPATSDTSARLAYELARDQLAAELSGADSDDVKALGFLALDLAGAAVIVSVHSDLDRLWWWVVIGLGASAILLFVSLWRRTFETGPRPEEFYRDASDRATAEDVALLAMEGVKAARTHNEGVRHAKARWYTASLVVLGITVIGSGIFLWRVQ